MHGNTEQHQPAPGSPNPRFRPPPTTWNNPPAHRPRPAGGSTARGREKSASMRMRALQHIGIVVWLPMLLVNVTTTAVASAHSANNRALSSTGQDTSSGGAGAGDRAAPSSSLHRRAQGSDPCIGTGPTLAGGGEIDFTHGYTNLDHCNWAVVCSPGTVPSISFTSFSVHMEPAGNVDYLNIYDGNSAAATRLARLTGSALPDPVDGNLSTTMLVQFTSDGWHTGNGFRAIANCHPVCTGLAAPAGGTLGSCPTTRAIPHGARCLATCAGDAGGTAVLPMRCNASTVNSPSSCCASGSEWDGLDGTPCTQCPAGKVDQDNNPGTHCTTCSAGYFSSTTGATAACAGACPVGTYGSPGARNATGCESCASGTGDSDSDPSTPCEACSAGYYGSAVGGTGCTDFCPTGTYAPPGSTAAADCVRCAPGTIDADSDSSTPCEACPSGRHSAATGATACSGVCPDGSTSVAGGQSESDCCIAGTYFWDASCSSTATVQLNITSWGQEISWKLDDGNTTTYTQVLIAPPRPIIPNHTESHRALRMGLCCHPG